MFRAFYFYRLRQKFWRHFIFSGTDILPHYTPVPTYILKMDRPSKRARLLNDDNDSESGEDAGNANLSINAEFARRFEHNEKRKELHQRKQPNRELPYMT